MKRRSGLLLSVLMLVAVVLAGCPQPTAPPPDGTAAPTQAAGPTEAAGLTEVAVPTAVEVPTEAVAPTTAPVPTGAATEAPTATVRIATVFQLETADPATASPWNDLESTVLGAIYETLVTYAADGFAAIVPGLAERWEISPDGMSLTFHLRKDACFASKQPFTAADVKFSFERLQAAKGPPAFLAETIEAIEVVDDYTVVLKLTQPDPGILAKLATPAFGILERAQVEEQGGDVSQQSAGSGPYLLAERSTGQIVLKPNPHYRCAQTLNEDEAAILFDSVVILPGIAPDVQFELLSGGEIDMAVDLTAEQAAQLGDTVTVDLDPSASLIYLVANLQGDGPLRNQPLVAEAIRYALRYDEIRTVAGEGTETPPSFIPRGYPETLDEGLAYDPERAAALLEQAVEGGFDKEKPLSLAAFQDSYWMRLAEVVQKDLVDIGLNVELAPTERPDPQLSDLTLQGYAPPYLDAQAYLDFLPGGAIARNIWQTDDDFLNQARELALREVDSAKRTDILTEAQRRINQVGPYAFLAQPAFVTASSAKVGYTIPRASQGYLLLSASVNCTACCKTPRKWCCSFCKKKCPTKCNAVL